MSVLRVHAGSRGLDVTSLEPGRDLVLEVQQEHGLDLPDGVAAQDHLSLEARRDVDRAAIDALARWCEWADQRLTFEGVGLAWAWEMELLGAVFIPTVRDAAGLRAAVGALEPDAVELYGGGEATRAIAEAALAQAGVPLKITGPAEPVTRFRPIAGSRWRRLAGKALRAAGAPSWLPRRSTLVLSYGPAATLLERLLADPHGSTPAASLAFPPEPAKLLQAGRRGGWTGVPGARARRAADRQLAPVFADWPRFTLEVMQMPLASALDMQALAYGRPRAAADVATLHLLERAIKRDRIASVVVPFDVVPEARLVIGTAGRHGVPTLFIQHGIPGSLTLVDGRESAHRALWAEPYARIVGGAAPVHVIGRPRGAAVTAPAKPRRLPERPTAVVLAQAQERATAVADARTMMRHFTEALTGLYQACPGATAVLRPHPAHDPAPAHRVAAAFAQHAVRVDARSDIGSLFATADLCIGALSTASAEAAAAGLPVVVLNITGDDWPWPFAAGGEVAIATDARELAAELRGLAGGAEARGHDELLRALGSEHTDALEALVRLVQKLESQ